MLYLVATPIGNLKDITLRALEILQQVDQIICEDTRRTSILLEHYKIQKLLIVLNDHNEVQQIPKIISLLQQGQDLALVSDAGTPLISDPGYKLVRECIKVGIAVDSVPGPSSVIQALVLSGLPPDKFLFWGYLPEKPGRRAQALSKIKEVSQIVPVTFILFVAPHKLITTLKEMIDLIGDFEIVLAKELTKVHQEIKRQRISEFLKQLPKKPKGEYVLLFNLSADS